MQSTYRIENLLTDVLIIGGGTAGCMAAIAVKETDPTLEVLILEKGHIDRSGCLAAGVNAINAYLNPGESPESFLNFVRREAHGLVREDLVASLSPRLNSAVDRLAAWGVPFPRDGKGNYVPRGRRSIAVHGERMKPILAREARKAGARVLNRVAATDFLLDHGRVVGACAISSREPILYLISSRAVILASGGTAGIYPSNQPLAARNRTWYPPFSTGAGMAMALRAGAMLTSLEMRFIALRVKHTLAPTGTVAQGLNPPQVNALGQEYLKSYGASTTAERLAATLFEEEQGRGPCFLDTRGLGKDEGRRLKEAYLDMSPEMVLAWADEDKEPGDTRLELTASEPYLVGGHGMAGLWVDVQRRTTLPGLWAAGDVAGGAPKKYVSGCLVEGEISGRDAALWVQEIPPSPDQDSFQTVNRTLAPMNNTPGTSPAFTETSMQGIMDMLAGGPGAGYRMDEGKLLDAREKLLELTTLAERLTAGNPQDLVKAHEVKDRLLVARSLVEHLLYRRETRWPAYQWRSDYPERDDNRWQIFINSRYCLKKDVFELLEYPSWEEGDTW